MLVVNRFRKLPVAAAAPLLALAMIAPIVAAPTPAGAASLFEQRFTTEEAFVDQMYRDFLSRGPDPAGLAFWSSELRSGVQPAALVEFLMTSPEFAQTTAPIVRLYHSVFDRIPDIDGLRFWVDRSASGASLANTAEAMLESAEFEALANASTSDEIVAAVYGRSLGRTPDAAGLAYWRDEIDAGRLTLPEFVVVVSESPEHQQLWSGEVVSTLIYVGMLQRAPEPGGLDYWTDLIDQGTPIRELAGIFLEQPEWRNRFRSAPTIAATSVPGFTRPWDVDSLPSGTIIVTERGGRLVAVDNRANPRTITADFGDLFASGETGLMGLAVDPAFTTNRRIYTCQGFRNPGTSAGVDIRVVAWTLDAGATAATKVGPIVTGMPLSSGRHGGCQLEFAEDGTLYIGTGDAAIGSTPQNLGSLGGKVLRVNPADGSPAAGNPFIDSANANTRLIYTYGHRNVQGLSERPGTNEMWSVEHGPSRDDEINRLRPGGNAGWNPVPGYNEGVTMTNTSLPNAFSAAYSTGAPTLALAGGEWLDDPVWGAYDNAMVVTSLKGRAVQVYLFNDDGLYLGRSQTLMSGDRMRGVHQADDGSLWVTSDNGTITVLDPQP